MYSRWTFPDLIVASIAQRHEGCDRGFIFWSACRLRDGAGSGVLSWPEVFALGTWLRWKRRSLLRILATNENLFWTFAGGGLFLTGPGRVAAGLNVPRLRAKMPLIASHLRGPLAVVRARLGIRAIAALRGGLPISNRVKCALLRVSVDTLQRWQKLAGVKVLLNLQLIAPLTQSTPGDLWRATGEVGLVMVRYRRRAWVARRLPNSFPPMRETRSRRRSLRSLNQRILVPGGEDAPSRIPDRGAVLYAAPELLQQRVGSLSRTPQRTTARFVFVGEAHAPGQARLWRAASPGGLSAGLSARACVSHAPVRPHALGTEEILLEAFPLRRRGGLCPPLPAALPPKAVVPEKIGNDFVHVNLRHSGGGWSG
jgi:hypothetical protein